MNIARIAIDQFPKNGFVSKLANIANGRTLFWIQVAQQKRPNHTRSCVDLCTRQHSQNVNMQLAGGSIVAVECLQLGYAFLAIKELAVGLHSLTQLSCCGHIQLLHPDGKHVCPEFFTVQFNIQQPIVPNVRV